MISLHLLWPMRNAVVILPCVVEAVVLKQHVISGLCSSSATKRLHTHTHTHTVGITQRGVEYLLNPTYSSHHLLTMGTVWVTGPCWSLSSSSGVHCFLCCWWVSSLHTTAVTWCHWGPTLGCWAQSLWCNHSSGCQLAKQQSLNRNHVDLVITLTVVFHTEINKSVN